MPRYGILRSSENNGLESDLVATFLAPLAIESKKPGTAVDTMTLKRKAAYTEIQRWEISAGLIPTRDAAELLVHQTVHGITEGFYVRMPQIYRSRPMNSGFVFTVRDEKIGGVSSVVLNVSTPGVILPVGEFIRFEGHTKVYMVKKSTATATRENTIEIFPSLVRSVEPDEGCKYGEFVTMAAMYDSNSRLGITYRDGIVAQIDNITLVERL